MLLNGKNSQLLIYIGNEKFIHMNPNVYDKIIKDSGKIQLK